MGFRMKYKPHILLPISIFAIVILFSLYLDRKQFVSDILVCEKPLGEKPPPFALNELFTRTAIRIEQSLAESTSVDDLIASSVISSTGSGDMSSLEILTALSRNNPQNQLAAVYALSACTKAADYPACNDEIINRAIALDGDNGAIWSLVSSLRYSQEDSYGAVLALEAAVEASDYDDYFQRGLGIVLNALPSVDDDLNYRLYQRAMNHGVSLIIPGYASLRPIHAMCSANVVENRALAAACLSFGRRMEEQASSLIASALGLSLQISTYGGLGNVAEYQRLEERARKGQQDRVNSDFRPAFDLLEHDAQLTKYLFDQLIFAGERAAIDTVVVEAKRLSSRWNYNPCPSVLFGNLLFVIKDFSRWALFGART